MDIKKEILMALHRKKRDEALKIIAIEFTEIDDISTDELLYLTIYYLNGIMYDSLNNKEKALESFENYIYEIDNLKVIDTRLKKICDDLYAYDKFSREDKIYMLGLKSKFKYDFIDWDCREWVIELLIYFYMLSLESLYFLKLELKFTKNRDIATKCKEMIPEKNSFQNNSGTSLSCNVIKRKEMLVNRIKPTYTLDEFADKLVMNIEKYKKIENEKNNLEDEESTDSDEKLSKMRDYDEFKDEKHFSKGNTDNMG